MEIYLKQDGTVKEIKGSRNFQGSDGSNVVKLFAPYDSSYSVKINLKLPNGSYYSEMMTFENDSWLYIINHPTTLISGRVLFSFVIKGNGKTLTTPILNLNIEQSLEVEE